MHHSPRLFIRDECSVHVCTNTIDYNVLTGIAVIAAARYFARAGESFRETRRINVFVQARCFICL